MLKAVRGWICRFSNQGISVILTDEQPRKPRRLQPPKYYTLTPYADPSGAGPNSHRLERKEEGKWALRRNSWTWVIDGRSEGLAVSG